MSYKKHLKISILIVLTTTILLIIKSRRVSQANFDFMVQIEYNNTLEICLKSKKQETQILLNKISKDSIVNYDYQLNKYGFYSCYEHEKLMNEIKTYYRKWYHKQWKFIY